MPFPLPLTSHCHWLEKKIKTHLYTHTQIYTGKNSQLASEPIWLCRCRAAHSQPHKAPGPPYRGATPRGAHGSTTRCHGRRRRGRPGSRHAAPPSCGGKRDTVGEHAPAPDSAPVPEHHIGVGLTFRAHSERVVVRASGSEPSLGFRVNTPMG